MITPELLDFLRTQRAEGMSLEELERLLVTEGGWNKEDVTEAFRQIGILPATPASVPESPVVQTRVESAEIVPAEIPVEIVSEVVTPQPSVEENINPDTPAPGPVPPEPEVAHAPEIIEVAQVSDEVQPEMSVVIEKKEEPKVVELSVTRSVPDLVVSVSQDDDFLGIFSEQEKPDPVPSREEKNIIATPPAVSKTETLSHVVFEPSAPTAVEPPAGIVQAHINSLAQNVNAVGVEGREVPVLSPDMTPLVFGKKPEWSFQDMLAQKKLSSEDDMTIVNGGGTQQLAVPKEEEVKGVKFDLSRVDAPVEKVSSAQVDPLPATPKVVPRPVETKSVAEIWLAGTNQSEKPIAPYSSATPRATIAPRRTMNSDLLRGKGGAVRSMPALSDENLPTPAVMPNLPPVPGDKNPQLMQKSAPVFSQGGVSLAEELKRKNKIKRIVAVVLGVLILLLLVGGAFVFLVSLRGPSVSERFASALSQFKGTTSFSYTGDGFADLVLSTPSSGDGVARSGVVKFALRFSGALKNGVAGYGDGAHRFKLSGGLQSGNYAWNTDVESDVKVIGNTLYFHLLSYPAASEFDPEIMKSQWIKVDLSVLAKELSISGGNAVGQGYGDFGSGESDMAFGKLYAENLPFDENGTLDDEQVGGVMATHVKLKADKERMYQFALKLYKKYFGKDLVLSSPQQLRLKDALGKISGEIWVDKTTNQLLKVMVRGDFDDDMVSAHVKGNTQLTFTLSEQGKEVSVVEPTPFLTLEEFRARTEEYKKNKELRASDTVKLSGLEKIVSALAVYMKEKGRYPATLLDLRSSGKLPSSVIDDYVIKQYSYASYLKPEDFSKVGRCTSKGKVCTFYHLGVNFEDLTNPLLTSDADATSEINGRDTAGCGGEMNLSCFDVVSTSLSDNASTLQKNASSTSR